MIRKLILHARPPRKRPIERAKPQKRTYKGMVFPSVAEMVFFQRLEVDPRVALIVHQPLFWLLGVKYHPDFIVMWKGGTWTVFEVKSPRARERPDWERTKRNLEQMFTQYGIRVHVEEVRT